jgi:DNA-binding CsgD family transcriptional regulator
MQDGMGRLAASGLLPKSSRVRRLVGARHAGFLGEPDLFTDVEMNNDPMYRDLIWPSGLGWAAATAIQAPTGDMMFLSVERERVRGPVESDVMHVLNRLRPHLARSALLSARLHLERARAASETLALLGLPALVMTRSGQVIAANSLTEDLGDFIRWRARDRITLKDAKGDLLLHQALASLDADATAPVRSFATRRTGTANGMIAHVLPIRRNARDLFARCAAILVLTPVTMPKAPPVDLIQSLFDLTPAEAQVASSLVAGDTPKEIAANRRVSKETVRTQVRGVLDKTGCRRQTDFVALVSGSVIDTGDP